MDTTLRQYLGFVCKTNGYLVLLRRRNNPVGVCTRASDMFPQFVQLYSFNLTIVITCKTEHYLIVIEIRLVHKKRNHTRGFNTTLFSYLTRCRTKGSTTFKDYAYTDKKCICSCARLSSKIVVVFQLGMDVISKQTSTYLSSL